MRTIIKKPTKKPIFPHFSFLEVFVRDRRIIARHFLSPNVETQEEREKDREKERNRRRKSMKKQHEERERKKRERKRERERERETRGLARISTIDRATLNRYRIASPLSCSMRPKASPARFPRSCDLSLRDVRSAEAATKARVNPTVILSSSAGFAPKEARRVVIDRVTLIPVHPRD